MKKTLLAAALIAGYAGAASAQNSVTLYGVIDLGLSYQNVSTGNNAATAEAYGVQANKSYNQFGMASGQAVTSRWGLKGVEDLGNGLKATFNYEAGINANNGASNNSVGSFNRTSTLGLSSASWGTVEMGVRSTAGSAMVSGIDPFAASYGTAALDSSFGTAFVRVGNQIFYQSPSISGFTGAVSYSFDTSGYETTYVAPSATAYTSPSFGTTNKNRYLSLGARYANGPLLVAGQYDTAMAGTATNAAQPNYDVKAWMLGATYDFKVAKLHAAYGQTIDGLLDGSTTLANASASGGDTNTKGGFLFAQGARTNSWMLGVSAPVGAAGKVFANVQQMAPGGNFKQSYTATQTVASVGYNYDLSKRTFVYAYYSYMKNPIMSNGGSANTLGAGIVHKF